MIVVDSSVWIDYFRNVRLPAVEFLDLCLANRREISICPFILVEVLCGFKSDREFEEAKELLIDLPCLEVSTETQVKAADLYRKLRRKGITVRSLLDCVIAQTCIEAGAQLLTMDSDFQHIARHSKLKLTQ